MNPYTSTLTHAPPLSRLVHSQSRNVTMFIESDTGDDDGVGMRSAKGSAIPVSDPLRCATRPIHRVRVFDPASRSVKGPNIRALIRFDSLKSSFHQRVQALAHRRHLHTVPYVTLARYACPFDSAPLSNSNRPGSSETLHPNSHNKHNKRETSRRTRKSTPSLIR